MDGSAMRGAKVKPLGAAASVGVRDERGCPDLRTWGQVLEVDRVKSNIQICIQTIYRPYIYSIYIIYYICSPPHDLPQ